MSACACHPLPDVAHNDPQSSPAIGAAPTNQFAKYYREGTYDYCPARFKAWHLCLKMKLSKPERAAELQQEARQRPHARWHDMHAHARWHDMHACLLYTSPSPRDGLLSRMPSSA